MWHAGGTAGESDIGSHLAATAPSPVRGRDPSSVTD
jgi:hypothetical protein